MKHILVLFFLLFILFSCSNNESVEKNTQEKTKDILTEDIGADDLENVINEKIAEEWDVVIPEYNTKQENIENKEKQENIIQKDEKNKTKEIVKEKINEDLIDDKNIFWNIVFPSSNVFWQAKQSWKQITYTNLPELSIKKQDIFYSNFNCSNITELLKTNSVTNFYWNTCRNVVQDKIISFYVTRSEGNIIFYEKHFIDYKNHLYITYKLKENIYRWKNILIDIEIKNTELKQLNWKIEKEQIINSLVKEIAK